MTRSYTSAKIGKAFYKAAFLLERYPLLARIMSIMHKLPVIWKVIELTPVGYDHLITLPNDKVIQINQSLKTPKETILPSQIVEYFIKNSEYRFLMNFCNCRYGNDCKNYPIGIGCIFIGEAAKKITPEYGRLVSKEEALDHVKKCREMGLVHLIGKDYTDALALGVSPHDKLLTICNCCQCCCSFGLYKHLPHRLAKTYKKIWDQSA